MSEKNNNTQIDPEVAIENALSKWEQFIEKNGKKLLIGLIAVVAVVGAYFAYENLYKQPLSNQAADAMFAAQKAFQQDSLLIALNGTNNIEGFIQITQNYGGTPQANLAQHYAGICFLQMGEYQKAVDQFANYNQTNNTLGNIIYAQNLGLTGDAYAQLGNLDKALESYTKAANVTNNVATTPTYNHKAAVVLCSQNKYAEAVVLFELIKKEFPNAIEARDIDKYIEMAKQKI